MGEVEASCGGGSGGVRAWCWVLGGKDREFHLLGYYLQE